MKIGPTDEEKTLNELVELSGIGIREVRGSFAHTITHPEVTDACCVACLSCCLALLRTLVV